MSDLRQKLNEFRAEARSIVDGADKENRTMSDDEAKHYDEVVSKMYEIQSDLERREKLDKFSNMNAPAIKQNPSIGMNLQEVRSYSLLRALRAASTGNWAEAGLEREASEAVAKMVGRDPRGFFVPYDFQAQPMESRSLTSGSSYGGYLIATETPSGNFIDLLRNKMVVNAAGATILSGLTGNVSIPKQSGGATAYWVAEGNSPSASNQTITQATLTPRTVGAYTDITRKLLMQSSMDVEMLVRNDLATVLALEIDRVALHGTGSSNEPTGIDHVSGIGSVTTGGSSALAWSHIVKLETEVSQDNADIGRLAYITNAKVKGLLKGKFANATYGEVPLWQDALGQLYGVLNGYRAFASNQVSATYSSSNSCIFFGNWADLLIGVWGNGLDILVDPYTGSTSGTVRVVALQDVDVTVRHAESFAAALDVAI